MAGDTTPHIIWRKRLDGIGSDPGPFSIISIMFTRSTKCRTSICGYYTTLPVGIAAADGISAIAATGCHTAIGER